MKNAIEIVKEYLIANGYDGLGNSCDECSCGVDSLAQCDGMRDCCEPGYAGPDIDNSYNVVMYPTKGERDKAIKIANEERQL